MVLKQEIYPIIYTEKEFYWPEFKTQSFELFLKKAFSTMATSETGTRNYVKELQRNLGKYIRALEA